MQYYRPGDEVAPEHKLERFLGRGGFGEVWKAIGPGGVELAVKIINLSGDQGLREFRAVRLLRRLRHPNLVPLSGFWLKDDRGYLMLEGSDGATRLAGAAAEMVIAMGLGEKSLYDRLKECKRAGIKGIPAPELLDYIEDAARAIDYLNEPAHDLGQGPVGIQHCDIKPANLLIVGNAAQVCDFGLARVLGDQVRASTAGALTPAYVAPEMIDNKPCRQTDQYSLAITYYELRTGELPFSASDPSAAMHAHQSGNLDFSSVPPPEQRVLRRATALDPSHRYPTTVEMVQDLRKASTAANRPASQGEIYMGGPIQPNQELVPGHKLVRKIGQGGYGEVWEGVAPGGIRCAFKIITNLDGSQNVQEFRILEMMKGLEHDHLMALQAYWLLDAEGQILPEGPGADSDRPTGTRAPISTMLVIQTQLAAKNLAQRLKECQNAGWPGIPSHELLPYMRQAASAIDYLNSPQHQLGDRVLSIQHRDIKPENILLSKQGSVKVSDFGLAKMVEGATETIHSKSRGLTAAYAAPEMFKGLVTRATDQYSLAITYYRLRTGRLPFDPNQPLFSMMLVHTEGRLDFGLLSLPEQEVLQRATKINPDERWPSCLDMVAALEVALGMRPDLTTHASLALSTTGPPPGMAAELTRPAVAGSPVSTLRPSADKVQPTLTPAGTAPSPLAPQAPLPPAVPVARVAVPPTLPPLQHPNVPRPGSASVTTPNLEKPSPASPGLPPTLPPTPHAILSRPVRSPALKTPPPLAPPLPPLPAPPDRARGASSEPSRDSGAGEAKPTQLAPPGEFDSNSEHPLLPSPHGETNVTLTRRPRSARSQLVVPPSEHREPTAALDAAILDEAIRAGEETDSGDEVIHVLPDQTDKVARARQQRRQLAKIVGGSLAATILGFLVVYWSTDSPPGSQTDPEQTIQRITTHIRSHRFDEALRDLEEAPLDDNTKDRLRAEAVDAWLKELGLPNQQNAERLVTELSRLRILVAKQKPLLSEPDNRYAEAVALYVPARVNELRQKNDFDGALRVLKTEGFDPLEKGKLEGEVFEAWVGVAEKALPKKNFREAERVLRVLKSEEFDASEKLKLEFRVLEAWVGVAKTALQEKDFREAERVAQKILAEREGWRSAVSACQEAQDAISDIVKRCNDSVDKGQLRDALDCLAREWKKGESELKPVIFSKWLARAEDLARKPDYSAAEKALDELLLHDTGNQQAKDLKKQVRKQRFVSEIRPLIREKQSLESYRAAIRRLSGPDGKELPDEVRKELTRDLGKRWLELARNEKALKRKRELLNELAREITSEDILEELAKLPPEVQAEKLIREAVQDLLAERFAKAKTSLATIRGQVSDDQELVNRIDTLMLLAGSFGEAAKDPLGSGLDDVGKTLNDATVVIAPEYRSSLERLHGQLLDRRIRLRVSAIPKDVDWGKLLAECNKVKEDPSTWVLACRVECLEALGQTEGSRWETACAQLRVAKTEPASNGYATYALTLADWRTPDKGDLVAAKRLWGLLGEPSQGLPAVLSSVPFRREKASRLLQAALTPLQRGGTFSQPFKNAEAAKEAYDLLTAAQKLAGDGVDLRKNLLLAAWSSKTPRARDLAGKLADGLVKDKKAFAQALAGPDRYRVLVIHAETRDNSADGRKAALRSYLTALDLVRGFLRNKAEPVVAEDFSLKVLGPLQANKGTELLGDKPSDEVKALFGRFCTEVAGLLIENMAVWSKLPGIDGKPAEVAQKCYDLAFANATDPRSRAEHLVLKGYAKALLFGVDPDELQQLAEQAIEFDKDFAGGYGLKGDALIRRSRTRKERDTQVQDLDAAKRVLDTALRLRGKLREESRRETESLLIKTKAVLLLELANYVTDSAEQMKELEEAKKFSEQSLRLDERSLDGWLTAGFILEDIALYGHKTDPFKSACEAFEKAMQLADPEGGQVSPWLGRGRTRFRWAEALRTARAPEAEVQELLKQSNSDFRQVFDQSSNAVEKAEAYFWQARGHDLLGNSAKAKESFGKARDHARTGKSRVWEELALYDWASLCYREANALYPKGAGLEAAIKEAEQQCDELAKLSPTKAAVLQVNLVRMAVGLGRAQPDDVAEVFKRGLESKRPDDGPFRVALLVDRSSYYLKLKPPDPDKAYEDARSAVFLARTTTVHPGTRAQAQANAGMARYGQALKSDKNEAYYDEAIQRLSEALRIDRDHYAAWIWKAYLANTLSLRMDEGVKSGAREIKRDANLAAEACRRYLEASQDLSTDPRNQDDADYFKGMLAKASGRLKDKAIPKLQQALKDFSADPAAWRWHWGIATVLAAETGAEARRQARVSLNKALVGARSPDDVKRLKKLQVKISSE